MAVGTVLSTVTLGWLTDDVVLPAFEDSVARRSTTTVVLAVLLVAAGRSAGVVVRRFFAGMTVFLCKSDMQHDLGRHYLAMPPEELRAASKGKLLAHADSDVDVATDALSPFPFTLGVLTLLGASIVSLALMDWVLTAVALSLMPLIAGLNQVNARVAEVPAVSVRESVSRVSSVASESFDGAMVVKTLGRETSELERFSVEAAKLRDDAIRLGRIRAIFTALLDLLPDAGVIALVALGAWRAANGHITPGQLVQAVALFSLLVFPLRVIGYFFGDLPPAVVANDRVVGALTGREIARTGSTGLPPGAVGVDIEAVSVRYGDMAAVSNASLRVDPGEVLALVGPTGSGKSTLLTAVLDMVPLAGGAVSIGGHNVSSIAPDVMSGRVAMAWQQPFLLDASVSENIAFGAPFSQADIEEASDAAAFSEVASAMPQGYDTVIGEHGVRLSGGQRQRLALARAIVRRPSVLLLDDATSAVDPVVEEKILNAIRAIDTTMVIVAHRRSTILLADRVALMANGTITAVGTHTELLANPSYVSLLEAYDKEASS